MDRKRFYSRRQILTEWSDKWALCVTSSRRYHRSFNGVSKRAWSPWKSRGKVRVTNRPNLGDVDNLLEIGQVKSWPKMYYSCSLFSWPFSEPLKTLLTESVFERRGKYAVNAPLRRKLQTSSWQLLTKTSFLWRSQTLQMMSQAAIYTAFDKCAQRRCPP